MKHFFMLLALALAITLSPSSLQAASAESSSITVIELFTSQSCSSCPPADAYLAELAQRPNTIAIACHVDYWNHLSWRDTLSHKFCTQRQNAYANARGSRRIFTPEIVVNGMHSTVGSRRNQVEKALKKRAPTIKPIVIETQEDGRILYRMPSVKQSRGLHILAMPYNAQHIEEIRRGENGGRTITYTHPVQDMIKVGQWDGKAHTAYLQLKSTDHIAILAQDIKTGKILAAGKL